MKLFISTRSREIWYGFILIATLLFTTACQPQPAPTLPPPTTSRVEETTVTTLVPTEVPTATVPLPTSTLAPSPTPSPTPTRAPGEPLVLPGTPVPLSQIPISVDNLKQVALLARWGTGLPKNLGFSADGSLLGVDASIARYLFETSTFTPVPFDLSAWEAIFSETTPSYEFSYESCTTTPCVTADVLRDGQKVGQMDVTGATAVSQDGRLVAGVLFNGRIQELWIYDLTTSQPLISIDTSAKGADGQPIPCFHEIGPHMDFSPDGKVLAAVCQGGAAYLFRVSDGALLHTFKPAEGDAGVISFSPDSKLFTTQHEGMQVWNVADGKLLFDLTESYQIPGADIFSQDFSPDGKYLAVAQSTGILQIYDLTDGSMAHELLEENPNKGTLDFSTDGDMLATVVGGRVQLRSVVDGSLLASAPIPGYPFEIYDIRFSPDGRKLALVGETGIDVWDVPEELGDELPYQGWIKVQTSASAFHPDGEELLVLSDSGIQSFNLDNLAPGGMIELPASPTAMDISPSGEMVAVGIQGELRILDYPKGKRVFNEPLDGEIEKVRFSSDGNTLLVSLSNPDASDTDYILYSTQDWSVLKQVPESTALGSLQVFSPEGQILATVSDERIVLRRAEDARGLVELQGHWFKVLDLAFSPDGSLIASIGLDDTIAIWGIP